MLRRRRRVASRSLLARRPRARAKKHPRVHLVTSSCPAMHRRCRPRGRRAVHGDRALDLGGKNVAGCLGSRIEQAPTERVDPPELHGLQPLLDAHADYRVEAGALITLAALRRLDDGRAHQVCKNLTCAAPRRQGREGSDEGPHGIAKIAGQDGL